MPHKRNPVSCIAILSNASRVPALVTTMLSCMSQDHERGTGNFHAEWETLTDIVQPTAGAVHQACILTNGFEVDTEKMIKNIELTNGLIYAENISLALAVDISKETAHTLMEKLCKEAMELKIPLKELVKKNDVVAKYISLAQVDDLFNPVNSIGISEVFIVRVTNKL